MPRRQIFHTVFCKECLTSTLRTSSPVPLSWEGRVSIHTEQTGRLCSLQQQPRRLTGFTLLWMENLLVMQFKYSWCLFNLPGLNAVHGNTAYFLIMLIFWNCKSGWTSGSPVTFICVDSTWVSGWVTEVWEQTQFSYKQKSDQTKLLCPGDSTTVSTYYLHQLTKYHHVQSYSTFSQFDPKIVFDFKTQWRQMMKKDTAECKEPLTNRCFTSFNCWLLLFIFTLVSF